MPDEKRLAPRLKSALWLAIALHGDDTRKASEVPYLAHLLGVCALVQHDGGTEDEAIAALLHDALEDKPELITEEGIRALFGSQVAAMVSVATDTPSDFRGGSKPPWQERKEAYLRRIRAADPKILRVTVADKIDNLRSTLADYGRLGEPFWDRFSAGKEEQLWYYGAALEAYSITGFQGPLLDELMRLVNELKALAAAT